MTVGSGMSSEAVSGAGASGERHIPFGIADWAIWALPARVRLRAMPMR